MHQYLDSDGSGTSATCVSSTIGAQRLQDATQWLQQNNLKGFLGEIGAGSNGTRRSRKSTGFSSRVSCRFGLLYFPVRLALLKARTKLLNEEAHL